MIIFVEHEVIITHNDINAKSNANNEKNTIESNTNTNTNINL